MNNPIVLKARMAAIKAQLYAWENDPNITKGALTEMIYNLLNFHVVEDNIKVWMILRGINDPTDSQNR